MNLPPDIELRINKQYQLVSDQSEVRDFLVSLWSTQLNVGPAQLSRAILVLADGDILEFRKIRASDFSGDPRDLILMAKGKNNKAGYLYFNDSFEDPANGNS